LTEGIKGESIRFEKGRNEKGGLERRRDNGWKV
jgi:hypothetical protein